ncbi:hypothetical protein [Pontibacter sp. H249]|uniref:hypothetical protein n=1 Tax=Pontibacter sp. H249 TaxID=3133420 RepID=UPI0030C06081
MQELKRLVKIIDSSNPRALPIVDPTDQSSLEGKLYNLIKNNLTQTDEEACLDLYGEDKLTPTYRMLKSRLRKKLLNSLFFTELSESHFRTGYVKYSECLSLQYQADKLVILGEYDLAYKIAEQVITIAKKAELNDLLVRAYDIKREANLLRDDRNKFEKDLELLQHYSYLDSSEREATLIYSRHKFDISLNLSSFKKWSVAYKQSLPKLEKLWLNTGSSKIYNYYHMLQIAYLESAGNFEGIVKLINNSKRLLDEGKVNAHWYNDRLNNFIKVYALLRLNQIEEGLNHASCHLNSFKEGSINWYGFLENYLLLSLHKQDYMLAVNLCSLAIDKGLFNFPVPRIKERWALLIEYVKLATSKTDIDTKSIGFIKQPEFSSLSKDKEGLNLSILILDFMKEVPNLDLQREEYHIERLSKYSNKYLKGEVGARSKLFIKLLILSMKAERRNLKTKVAPLLAKLKSTPPPQDPIAEIEIVPYEHLWQYVLEVLEQRG